VADEPQYKLETGLLMLSPTRRTNDLLGAVLARSTTVGDYTARTVIPNLQPGVFAGLAAFGDPANAIGIAASDAKVVLWRRQKGKHEVLFEMLAPKSGPVQLSFVARNGHQFQFFLGADAMGKDVPGKHLPPWDRNVRVALTVGGAEGAVGKFSDFSIIAQGMD
jgi:hypothetical protein